MRGLTLFEVLIVVAVVFFLAIVFSRPPNNARGKARRINCVVNLKEVNLGYRLWEEAHTNFPMGVSMTNGGAMEFAEKGIAYPVFRVMSNELATPKILYCMADKDRTAATNFSSDFDNSHLSYFIGLVPDDSNPNAILGGDDNLMANGIRVRPGLLTLWTNAQWTPERHYRGGNIALADGSVQQVTSNGLHSAVSAVGAPSRVVIP